jgi:uncharacterized protein
MSSSDADRDPNRRPEMTGTPARFSWYELVTPDLAASQEFYGAVAGWTAQRSTVLDQPYTWFMAGDVPVAGMMETQPEGCAAGWTGSIEVRDVDDAVARVTAAGGSVRLPPEDIPGMVRCALLADPQGASFGVFHGLSGEAPPKPAPGAPGTMCWHELYAAGIDPAFDFYSGLFGWTRADSFDMGEMGEYRVFAAGGMPTGGMMRKPDWFEKPFWLFYITVDDIDAAASRVTGGGGRIMHGPMEVPGGSVILQCLDPQGTMFALNRLAACS